MKRKSLILSVMLIFILLLSQAVVGHASQGPSVLVNGKTLTTDTPPVIEQGRVLVPLRAIFEALGADVKYDDKTGTVNAELDGVKMTLKIGDKTAVVGGKNITMDVPAKIVKQRTVVPLRFVSESLGATVDWNAAAMQVIVNTLITGRDPIPAGLTGTLKLSGSTSVQPLAEELAQAFMKKYPGVKITITGGGSGVGIKDAAEGKVNIGNASRALKDSDPKGIVGTTICKDALVVILNPKNPVKELTKDQVKKIYTGQITNWKEVGGKDAPILVNGRTAPSGTFDFFVEEFLDKEKNAATVKQHASSGLVRQAVAANENAIGYVSLGYVDNTVSTPKMNGVVPTMETAKNGTYHFVRPFLMITKGEPTGLSYHFLTFVLSKEGQSIVSHEYIKVQ